jgi:hypothetical protein
MWDKSTPLLPLLYLGIYFSYVRSSASPSLHTQVSISQLIHLSLAASADGRGLYIPHHPPAGRLPKLARDNERDSHQDAVARRQVLVISAPLEFLESSFYNL